MTRGQITQGDPAEADFSYETFFLSSSTYARAKVAVASSDKCPQGGAYVPGASRPALWASSAGGLQPPDPQGLRAPLWPLNASTGPLRPVWQVGGAAWAPVASESLYGPLVTCSAGLGVFVEIQKFVVEARRGGQVPDRRSRPSTAAGGGRGACPSDAAQGKRRVGNAQRCPRERVSAGGGQVPDRRSRPSTAAGGGRGGLSTAPPRRWSAFSGGGWGPPLAGRPGAEPPGRHSQSRRYAWSKPEVCMVRFLCLKACSKPCFRFA